MPLGGQSLCILAGCQSRLDPRGCPHYLAHGPLLHLQRHQISWSVSHIFSLSCLFLFHAACTHSSFFFFPWKEQYVILVHPHNAGYGTYFVVCFFQVSCALSLSSKTTCILALAPAVLISLGSIILWSQTSESLFCLEVDWDFDLNCPIFTNSKHISLTLRPVLCNQMWETITLGWLIK